MGRRTVYTGSRRSGGLTQRKRTVSAGAKRRYRVAGRPYRRASRGVRRTVSSYTTPGEARGVLRNIRRGGRGRYRSQVRTLRSQVRSEFGAKRAQRVVSQARTVRAGSRSMRRRRVTTAAPRHGRYGTRRR